VDRTCIRSGKIPSAWPERFAGQRSLSFDQHLFQPFMLYGVWKAHSLVSACLTAVAPIYEIEPLLPKLRFAHEKEMMGARIIS
jgi:hypothetical protein